MEHFVRIPEIIEKMQGYIGLRPPISAFYSHVKVFLLSILTYSYESLIH